MIASARRLTHIFANSSFTAGLLRDIGVQTERIEVLSGGVESARFSKAVKAGPESLTLHAVDMPEEVARGIVSPGVVQEIQDCAPSESRSAGVLSEEVKPSVLGHCPTALRAALKIPPERFVLLTACRMVRKKGVDFLLDNMEALVARMPDAHLILVGSGRHEKRFRRQAARSGASAHITFTGRVPHDQIESYYRAADLFVLASRIQVDPRTGLMDAATMGRVLCEANAAGLPVVAARSGGIPSVIQDRNNGLLFEPDNFESLCEALEVCRAQPTLVEHMIARGVEKARECFDWSVIVDEHERRFQEILGSQTPSLRGAHV